MRIASRSAMEKSILTALGSIDKFLHYDLTSMLSDGRQVLEPQKDWVIIVENCHVLRSFRFLLTEHQNNLVDRLILNLEANHNEVVEFLREFTKVPRKLRQSEEGQLLARLNFLL